MLLAAVVAAFEEVGREGTRDVGPRGISSSGSFRHGGFATSRRARDGMTWKSDSDATRTVLGLG